MKKQSVLLFSFLLLSVPPQLVRADDSGCFKVRSKIYFLPAPSVCDSPVHSCADISVRYGTLKGDILFSANSIVQTSNSTFAYNGIANLKSTNGALQFSAFGQTDTQSNTHAAVFRVTGGTGDFANAKGVLYSTGSTTAGIAGLLVGEICGLKSFFEDRDDD